MERLTKSIVVMASGSGTTFEALAQGLKGSEIEIKALLSNKSDIGAISKSQTLGIRALVHGESDLLQLMNSFEPDLIVLAGYLKKLPSDFIHRFQGKIINVHPSLLPKYGGKGMYGRNVHKAVRESGDSESGATVHWVTENYDEGPIVAQVRIPIHPNEDVESIEIKVKSVEKELLLSTVKKILG